jgi:hypothetical protein
MGLANVLQEVAGVTAFSLSLVDSRISEILTPYFRFAVAHLPPNFSE